MPEGALKEAKGLSLAITLGNGASLKVYDKGSPLCASGREMCNQKTIFLP
jgi:hypothetical protein